MTGNIGIVGDNSGVSNGATGRYGIGSLPAGKNPIDCQSPRRCLRIVEKGSAGGYPDIKLIYSMAGDIFGKAPNTEKP